ncbi:uncharacterized protein FA14DRAFT_155250 [Meira miltonrushii]|uniref:Homeobox domain-containing protein n=1 Tax=Meira miltonrushii TaxID=1280837 RepID=A0A316VFJ5_9BASI|nr:uncharacterized protein FA14DRAFT_155250 [Meira miltonrushii]PWN35838.1 hypothetical protein FA14DRAFT_155250 [Meira miltonrushii]
MLASSKIWLDRGGSSLNNHLSTTIDHQNEEEEVEAKEIAADFTANLTRQSTTIMNAWNRDYPTGAPRSEGQSAGLESGQSALSAQQTSPFAVTQGAWSSSPEQHTYAALPSINAPVHPGGGGGGPPYGHTTSFEGNEVQTMNYGSGGGSSDYSMLARPHSSGGNQSGTFPMMNNRQYFNPNSSQFGHSTAFAPAPGMHSSPNHSMGHAPTFSDPLSGGHYTFSSGGGANAASGLALPNPNPESSFHPPSMQSGEHERDSYVYSNVQGNLTPLFGGMPGNAPPSSSTSSHHDFPGFSSHHQSSSSAPSHYHHHHHHFSTGGGSTYPMLGGAPLGHAGGHYMSGAGQYEGYPAFYNPFEVKHRRRTTRSQFKVLESTFLETPKPTASTRKILAEQLDMPLRAIQIWFQNRRAKAKSQSYRSSTTSHSIHGGGSSSSKSGGRFVDSPPLHTSQRTGSGSAGVGRPSTSSSSSSYYHGPKSAIAAHGASGDSKPPLSSSSLSSTGSAQTQAGAGFPFEDSKRYTYSNTGAPKPIHVSRLDLPPLTSGEPSSGSSSFAPSSNPSFDSFKIPSGKPSQRGSAGSSGAQQHQQSYSHSNYNPMSGYSGTQSQNSPNLQNNPSGAIPSSSSSSQSNANDIADEQNRRSHQSSSWR